MQRVNDNAPAPGSAYALTPTPLLTFSPPASNPTPRWSGAADSATPPCPVCGYLQTQLITALCEAQRWPESQLVSTGHRHRWHPGQTWPAAPDEPTMAANAERRAADAAPEPGARRSPAELERLLAPPPVPTAEHHGAFYAGAALTSGGLLCLPFTLLLGAWAPGLAHAVNLLLNTLCFGAAGGLFLISFLTSSGARARYDAQRQQWESQMQKWTTLRFCARCNNVFQPATGQATRPHYLRSLL